MRKSSWSRDYQRYEYRYVEGLSAGGIGGTADDYGKRLVRQCCATAAFCARGRWPNSQLTTRRRGRTPRSGSDRLNQGRDGPGIRPKRFAADRGPVLRPGRYMVHRPGRAVSARLGFLENAALHHQGPSRKFLGTIREQPLSTLMVLRTELKRRQPESHQRKAEQYESLGDRQWTLAHADADDVRPGSCEPSEKSICLHRLQAKSRAGRIVQEP
jgi:hypothetical protein